MKSRSPIQWRALRPVFTLGHTPGLVREHFLCSFILSGHLFHSWYFQFEQDGKKKVPTGPQEMNLPIYEYFIFSWNRHVFLSFWFFFKFWPQLYAKFNANIRGMKLANWYFCALFSCLSGLTGCGYLGIIIIILGIWAETGALSLCSQLSFRFVFIYESKLKEGKVVKQQDPHGLIITEILSRHTLYTDF